MASIIKMHAKMFFDRQKVIDALGKARKASLSKAGGLVRTIARRSMRKRRKPSPPGKPPRVVRGLLKKFLFFGYEAGSQTVVVGPAALKPQPVAPATLEYGGNVARLKARKFTAMDFYNLGYGPIDFEEHGADLDRDAKGRYLARRSRLTWTEKGKVRVTRVRLTTMRQARRAALIHNTLGIGGRPAFDLKPRPYMKPALQIARPKLPATFKDSIRA